MLESQHNFEAEPLLNVEGDHLIITPGGPEVDLTNHRKLAEGIAQAIGHEAIKDIAVNLADVEFIDSTGLRALSSAGMHAKNSAKAFSILNPSDPVQKVMQVMALDKEIKIKFTDDRINTQHYPEDIVNKSSRLSKLAKFLFRNKQ